MNKNNEYWDSKLVDLATAYSVFQKNGVMDN